MGKIRRGHSNCGCDGYRRYHFFSGQLMAVNEKRQKQLIEHYKRINDNVFKAWSIAVPTLGSTAGTLPYSFMPLYTNVISIIKSPGRYHEAKSHLGDSYLYVNKILNDIVSEIKGHLMRKTYHQRAEIDADINIINLKNGLYSIRTGEFKAHSPDYISINQVPIVYNPESKPKLFGQFLHQVLWPSEIRTAI
ncbi:MAG: hypothetical protein WAM14_06760 [Candidatus Nitrosopolaris sp.]